MGFGQVVIGPPGSGKTTYCWGLQQYFKAIGRKSIIINLDPAVLEIPYETSIDIRELINLKEVMVYNRLGPNGSILFCLEYLENHLDWLIEKLKINDDQEIDPFIVLDLPGQIELSTDHQSLKNILHKLEKLDWRLAVVQLTDATHIVDAAKYVSIVLLNLKAMLNLGLPHINVLSKIDLLKGLNEEFKLNLDFYTDVQDLSYLLPLLDQQTTPKFSQLNRAMIDLIEDFNLVGFETLYVEDKASMTKLTLAIDKALGYYSSSTSSFLKETVPNQTSSNEPTNQDSNQSLGITHLPIESLSEIQERWLDYPDEYESHQRQKWSEEGDLVFKKATEKSQADAIMRNQNE
ncbi:uncharacterized protein MELLADRAFT_94067 [Melampsora larici-populina 98AG31]|uniref:GPN-loop GTPase 2 n=1 Tax=Melampsora larici-populina (strain 98AG31 / pathotype 3-4-7) TaxID=747676 RepID=F4S6A3_MELLP|nr:uncharacterized protein MELLADRAFT_94067 [Melampsora larici-populina 98AG31]EGF99779.1 hypothetical protein MELLADRAFT_94067 [Melampsora larici-populina 98AG31]